MDNIFYSFEIRSLIMKMIVQILILLVFVSGMNNFFLLATPSLAGENEIPTLSNDSTILEHPNRPVSSNEFVSFDNQLSSKNNFEIQLKQDAVPIENSFYQFEFPNNQEVLYRKELDSHLETCRIFLDGTFFAEFRTNYRGTPIVWPICSENGTIMTRSYPMIEDEKIDELPESNDYEIQYKNVIQNALVASVAESKDHPHQRSLWFTHGNVNDCDFWALTDSSIQSKITYIDSFLYENKGQITKGVRLFVDGHWINGKTKQPLCGERRVISFGQIKSEDLSIRFIDYNVSLIAIDESVSFGDTKEGTFGVRVPGSMDVDATRRNSNWKGQILNNWGDLNEKAWGKRAEWVDYSGTVARRLNSDEIQKYFQKEKKDDFELTTAGITIMNSPQSFRFPSWYHVRTYGLFAVNPFGWKDFEPERKNEVDGSYLLTKEKRENFDYRVVFHDGQFNSDQLQALFDNYCFMLKPVENP